MLPQNQFFALILVIPNLIVSCGPVLYSNVGQNVPLFQEKGEFSGLLAYSEGSGAWSASGVAVQGAYSVSDNVAVISSFYAMKGIEADDNEWEGNGSYFEIGAGRFGGDPGRKVLYEIFAGLGVGSIQNQSIQNRAEFINVAYLKPFFQPSASFSTKYFDLALTPRVSYLTYSSKNDFLFLNDGDAPDAALYFEKNDNRLLFEPGILIRGGLPGVKVELQYNYSTLGEPLADYFLVNNEFVSIGFRFLISDRISLKQNKKK